VTNNLTTLQKTAVLLTSLTPETSALLLSQMDSNEAAAITHEISNLPQINSTTREAILSDFTSHARNLGSDHSFLIKRKPKNGNFAYLEKVDERTLVSVLQREHPQTVALALSHLRPERSSQLLSCFQSELQVEYARRLAEIVQVSDIILKEVERLLKQRVLQMVEDPNLDRDGRAALKDMLNFVSTRTQDSVMTGLSRVTPQLAKRLRRNLCDFEDIRFLSQESLALLVRLVDHRDLIAVLWAGDRLLQTRVLNCCVDNKRQQLTQAINREARPCWREVREARRHIRNIMRGLLKLGKITL
jgi:flagellar motor switch protein FliG